MATLDTLFSTVTGASPDDEPVGDREPRNALIHLASLSATKIADGILNPKLVLSWLLGALGAPGLVIGALVPIREAGALLPQLALAPRVATATHRAPFWAVGSALQGLAALAIAGAAFLLDGAVAWVTILAALLVLATARAACSVSYKDALARSIAKTRRGAVTGAAATVGSAAVLLFGACLAFGIVPLTVAGISAALGVAGVLWLVGSVLFTRLTETGDGSQPDSAPSLADLLAPLREDGQLVRFVLVRALLVGTALAPPFLVMLSAVEGDSGPGQLGPLVLASAAASIVSAYVWGRLSDRSSRQTLMAAGGLAALVLGASAATGLALGNLGGLIGSVAAIFFAQVAYEGVRAGRKLHLTDMADDDNRARYTALSNTLIGGALVVGAGFGLLADLAGVPAVLAAFAGLCALAVVVAARLDEVQNPD